LLARGLHLFGGAGELRVLDGVEAEKSGSDRDACDGEGGQRGAQWFHTQFLEN